MISCSLSQMREAFTVIYLKREEGKKEVGLARRVSRAARLLNRNQKRTFRPIWLQLSLRLQRHEEMLTTAKHLLEVSGRHIASGQTRGQSLTRSFLATLFHGTPMFLGTLGVGCYRGMWRRSVKGTMGFRAQERQDKEASVELCCTSSYQEESSRLDDWAEWKIRWSCDRSVSG